MNTRKKSYKRAGSMPGIQINKCTVIVSFVIKFRISNIQTMNILFNNQYLFYPTPLNARKNSVNFRKWTAKQKTDNAIQV